jgi:shikimate kinase
VDTDAEIARLAERTIATIFAEDGEDEFRRLERACVLRTLEGEGPSVVALGGGAFLDDTVRQRCGASDTVSIYLHVSPAVAVGRVGAQEGQERPLLAEDPLGVLAALYAVRDPVYRRAEHVVETDGRPVDAVVAEVLTHV